MNNEKSPVLFLIFNRFETARKVFEKIKEYQPNQLFISSDGPRAEKEGEIEIVNNIRSYILAQVDWDCEIKTLFHDKNLGCGMGPCSAISWFFEHVEKGIILEDDCLPSSSFFTFCHEMLHYYANDERIFEISGNNVQGGKIRGNGSYYFSRYGGIWGWASWARAWNKFDYRMSLFDKFYSQEKIKSLFSDTEQQRFWIETFKRILKRDTWDHWDYQWLFAIWNNDGICIVPNGNLVTNIGFNEVATHTITEPEWYNKLSKKTVEMQAIIHPSFVIDSEADLFQFKNTIVPENTLKRRFKQLRKKLGI